MNYEMKIEDCRMGLIVCTKNDSGVVNAIGMIVGITHKPCKLQGDWSGAHLPLNAIPLVQWSEGHTKSVNFTELYKYKGHMEVTS